jgi:phosphoglycolate phosphatase/pyrophosphatase PpaX
MAIRAVIFDLDMTLVDSSALEPLRRERRWSEVYRRFDMTHVYPGIKQAIESLRGRPGLRLGVVTSAPRTYADRIIAYHHLGLEVFVGYHDTPNHKPHPAPLLLATQKLGLRPSEVLSVGDEAADIVAARAAGTIAVAAAWGRRGDPPLAQASPDAILHDPIELMQWVP